MPARNEPLPPADEGPVERPLGLEPERPNDSGATTCIVRWMVETPSGWIGAHDKDAFNAYRSAIVAEERERVRAAIEAFPHWLGPQAKRELLAALFGPNVL